MADLVNEAISWLQAGEPVTGGTGGNSNGVLNRPLVQLLANDNCLQDRVDIIADDDGYYKKIISSIKITETDAATTARVQIDTAGLKQYDGTNKVVDLDEAGNVTIGYNANDKITVAAGVLTVLANELDITGSSNSGITLNNSTAVGFTITGAGTIGMDILDATQYGLKLGNCTTGGYGPLHMVNAGVTGAANLHSTYGSATVDTLAVDDAHDLFIKTGSSIWQKVGATASPVAVVDTATITGTATTDNSVIMDANGLTMRKAAGAVRFDVNEDGSFTLGNSAGAKVGFTTGDALSMVSATLTSCSISGGQIDSGTVAAVRIADLSATYAVVALGVTNGDSHDHFGGDGAQIDHVNLANKGTNTHTVIDSHISASAAHSATGAVAGTTNTQTFTNKTLTSPKINEDVVLIANSTEIDNIVDNGYFSNQAVTNVNITETSSGPGRISLEKAGIIARVPASSGSSLFFSVWSKFITSGTSTSTSSNKLIDSGGGFSGIVAVDDIVLNRDDDTNALVTNVDSDTSLSLSADIFTVGENYEIFYQNAGDITIGGTSQNLIYDYSTDILEFKGGILAGSTLPTGGSAIVAQSNLKSSLPAEVSYTGDAGGANVTLPGGEYGFYPQIRMQTGTTGAGALIGENFLNTSFVTNIRLKHNTGSSKSVYAQQRYITSSGEVYWIFLLRDKTTKDIICTYFACDHPCFGNGNDPDVVQHPFPDYDSSIHEIIVLLPNEEELDEIDKKRGWKNGAPKKELYTVLKQLYDIDDTLEPEWPIIDITVGLNKERTKPVKVKVNKPSFIKTAKLKKKEE